MIVRFESINRKVVTSVVEPELELAFLGRLRGPVPYLSQFFLSVGAESRSRLFKAALAVSLRKAKKNSLVLVLSTGMNAVQFTV